MPVLKRRSRIVIFRLTEDEYAQLKTACATRGARNVSDFARNALFESVTRGETQLADKLDGIENGVRRLEQRLAEMSVRNGAE